MEMQKGIVHSCGNCFVGEIAYRIASEHCVEHEEIWGLNVTENGSCVVHVYDRSCEELAQSERNVVETGLDHVAVNLTDFGGGFALFQCENEVVVQ